MSCTAHARMLQTQSVYPSSIDPVADPTFHERVVQHEQRTPG
jgi:hypothetical protein